MLSALNTEFILMHMDAPKKQHTNKQHNVPFQHKSNNKMNTINTLTLMLSSKQNKQQQKIKINMEVILCLILQYFFFLNKMLKSYNYTNNKTSAVLLHVGTYHNSGL